MNVSHDRHGTMREIQRSLLEMVWPEGRNPAVRDGRHYVLKGFSRPVSVSSTEAYFLSNITALSRPRVVFEIGTGFGYSALWFALGVAEANTVASVISLDDHSEGGLGEAGGAAAELMAGLLDLESIVDFRQGKSPGDVPAALTGQSIDIGFIDANHHGSHPLDDYEALRGHMTEDSLLLFHDVDGDRYTVPAAVAQANRDGWSIKDLQTSCHLTAAYRDDAWHSMIRDALAKARKQYGG